MTKLEQFIEERMKYAETIITIGDDSISTIYVGYRMALLGVMKFLHDEKDETPEDKKIVSEELSERLGLGKAEEKKKEPEFLILNNLMWSNSIGRDLTFDEAKEYAKNCRDGGYDDWRVPSASELEDTIDWERGTSAVGVGSCGYYWSSTQYDGTNGRSLSFYSGNSYMYNTTKSNGFSVRCVRDLNKDEAPEDKWRTQGYVEGGGQ